MQAAATIGFSRNPVNGYRMPAAMGTMWRARDGRRLACLVNVSGTELRLNWQLPDGATNERQLTLPPRSVTSIPLP